VRCDTLQLQRTKQSVIAATKLALHRRVAVVKGLDFGRHFAAQFGGLLTGAL
jgi:hypothetical protein